MKSNKQVSLQTVEVETKEETYYTVIVIQNNNIRGISIFKNKKDADALYKKVEKHLTKYNEEQNEE